MYMKEVQACTRSHLPFEEQAAQEEFTDGNPILTQHLQGLDPQRPDIVTSLPRHADLVSTPDGDWYAVFLACRPYEEDFTWPQGGTLTSCR